MEIKKASLLTSNAVVVGILESKYTFLGLSV